MKKHCTLYIENCTLKEIPIIVLNWNGLEDTLACMASLKQQTYTDFKVYLADNGSEKSDVSTLKARFADDPQVVLSFNATNLGFTKAHNLLFEKLLQEEYSYIVTLNNDTTQEPDWLENLIAFAHEKKADMVSSKMVNFFDRTKMDNAGHRMLNTAEIIPLASGEPIENWNAPFKNFGPCAGAALYSTAMMRDIGIFDERFSTGYEDAEYGVRASILGYTSWYVPKAVVYHKVSASINKVLDYEYKLNIQEHIFYTYYKLMPKALQWINFPSFVFKYTAIFGIDIILRRKVFYKVMKEAWRRTLRDNKSEISTARQKFYGSHQPMSTWRIWRMQTFFLWFDIKRFWKFVVVGEKSFLEK